jgi:hypothetical protein
MVFRMSSSFLHSIFIYFYFFKPYSSCLLTRIQTSHSISDPVLTAGLVAKGWFKSGIAMVSAGENAFPIDGPCTAEIEGVFVKVHRKVD